MMDLTARNRRVLRWLVAKLMYSLSSCSVDAEVVSDCRNLPASGTGIASMVTCCRRDSPRLGRDLAGFSFSPGSKSSE